MEVLGLLGKRRRDCESGKEMDSNRQVARRMRWRKGLGAEEETEMSCALCPKEQVTALGRASRRFVGRVHTQGLFPPRISWTRLRAPAGSPWGSRSRCGVCGHQVLPCAHGSAFATDRPWAEPAGGEVRKGNAGRPPGPGPRPRARGAWGTIRGMALPPPLQVPSSVDFSWARFPGWSSPSRQGEGKEATWAKK